MNDIFSRLVSNSNRLRADRVNEVNQRILESTQAQIGQHVGFDDESGLAIAQFPDGGQVRYLPLNFGVPTSQMSLITASGIPRGDWHGYL